MIRCATNDTCYFELNHRQRLFSILFYFFAAPIYSFVCILYMVMNEFPLQSERNDFACVQQIYNSIQSNA